MTPEPRPEELCRFGRSASPKKCRNRVVHQQWRGCLGFCVVKMCTTEGNALRAASRKDAADSAAPPADRSTWMTLTTAGRDPNHSGFSVLMTK